MHRRLTPRAAQEKRTEPVGTGPLLEEVAAGPGFCRRAWHRPGVAAMLSGPFARASVSKRRESLPAGDQSTNQAQRVSGRGSASLQASVQLQRHLPPRQGLHLAREALGPPPPRTPRAPAHDPARQPPGASGRQRARDAPQAPADLPALLQPLGSLAGDEVQSSIKFRPTGSSERSCGLGTLARRAAPLAERGRRPHVPQPGLQGTARVSVLWRGTGGDVQMAPAANASTVQLGGMGLPAT